MFGVIHPYHPLHGQEFELVEHRTVWGEHRVYFYDELGDVRSILACWTSVATADPFVVVAAGRSYFRVEDLLALAALIRGLKE
jgi:hypothetical protein